MRRAAIIAFLMLAACRAQVDNSGGDGGDAGDGMVTPDDMPVNLDGGCAAVGPEICDNGCDDDQNGFTDDDDAACTTQVIGTSQLAAPSLGRLILEPTPHFVQLDPNPVPAGGFAMWQRAFSPDLFMVFDNATKIRRLALGGSVGVINDYTPTPSYPTRDVCVFNGELIVVERNATSVLHRLKVDGMTEVGTVSVGTVFANACASDGKFLYVTVHDQLNNPSTFLVFDKDLVMQGSAIAMPTALTGAGLDRCLDFAWTKKGGFYGLFVNSSTYAQPLKDQAMSANQIFPFALDGGVGSPVDAGTLHGLGEFLP